MKSSSVLLRQHKPLFSLTHGHVRLHRKKKKVGYLAHIFSILRGYPKSKNMLLVGRNHAFLAKTALFQECSLETSRSTSCNVACLLDGKSSFRRKQRRVPRKTSLTT